MSSQSVPFEWTAPLAIERAVLNASDPADHPVVRRALEVMAQERGLDAKTVRTKGVKRTNEGPVVMAEAEPLRNV